MLFEHKMPLDFILLTIVHAHWPKLVPNFVEWLNKNFGLKQIVISLQILISFQSCTVPLCRRPKSFAWVQYRNYLVMAPILGANFWRHFSAPFFPIFLTQLVFLTHLVPFPYLRIARQPFYRTRLCRKNRPGAYPIKLIMAVIY